MTQAEIYAEAGQIATVAMGIAPERERSDGRKLRSIWAADNDPLAWVCIMENIVSLVERSRNPTGKAK